MAMKAAVCYTSDYQSNGTRVVDVNVVYYDEDEPLDKQAFSLDAIYAQTFEEAKANILSNVLSYSSGHSYGIVENEILWLTSAVNPIKSFANPSRTLNSAYQISTTREALVSYGVDISCLLNLTVGQAGSVFLEYADDSGFTTNVVEVTRTTNSNTGALTLGSTTQVSGTTLSGLIPIGKYVRLRTANTTGTPTFTFRRSQEVLI